MSQPAESQDPMGILGTVLEGKYRIAALAGEGGFSTVYRAEHLVWSEPVALKFFTVLQDAPPKHQDKLLNDFIQEGKLMSRLSSRSAAIVQARDIGKLEVEGGFVPYMVLEWLDGTSLDVVLRDERAKNLPARTIQEAVSLLEPAAVALEVAHGDNVAHRDLKPANLVVMGDARQRGVALKVLDFGIAKVMAEHAQFQEKLQQTGQQVTAFTPYYGSPEQFSRNFGATGPWTDVYAMALILVELLRGGERALGGSSFFELGQASCNAEVRPTPIALGVDVPGEIEDVFAHALALSPKDRFPTMGAFWVELHRAVFPSATTWLPRSQVSSTGAVSRPSLPEASPPSSSDFYEESTASLKNPAARTPGARTPVDSFGDTVNSGQVAALAQKTPVSPSAPATPSAVSTTVDPVKSGRGSTWTLAAIAVVGVGVAAWFAMRGGRSETTAAAATSAAAPTGERGGVPRSSGETVASAEATATATSSTTHAVAPPSASAPVSTIAPPVTAASAAGTPPRPGAKEKTAPPPPTKPGADPWDPSNFGGR